MPPLRGSRRLGSLPSAYALGHVCFAPPELCFAGYVTFPKASFSPNALKLAVLAFGTANVLHDFESISFAIMMALIAFGHPE